VWQTGRKRVWWLDSGWGGIVVEEHRRDGDVAVELTGVLPGEWAFGGTLLLRGE
jgi:hypothetical protein